MLATEPSLIGEGLSATLGLVADVEVVGRALGPEEIEYLVERAEPDALVVTLRAGSAGTTDTLLAVRRLHARFSSLGIVVISDRPDPRSLDLLADGVARIAYLLDHEIPRFTMMLDALRTVCEGGSLLGPGVVDALEHRRPISAVDHVARPHEPPVEVALLDPDGVIVAVNEAWRAFGRANGADPDRTGVGVSYLDVCLASAADPEAEAVGRALRHALSGGLPAPMQVQIPCHGPEAHRHFDVLISSRRDEVGRCLGATVTLSPVV